MKKRKAMLLVAISIATIGAYLLTAEIVLRFLPVADSLFVVTVTPENPIYRFTPNRSVVYSRDWNFNLVNRSNINNDGWYSAQNYRREDKPPMLAIIGDSLIAAPMVPYPETAEGRLASALKGKLRVYNFAGPGAPLSEYLMWAAYAVHKYGAKGIIINVCSNDDLDESHAAYRRLPGFWFYAPSKNGELQLKLSEFHSSFIKVLLRHSALARYLIINCDVRVSLPTWDWLYAILGRKPRQGDQLDETAADARRTADSLAVIDAFFRDLPGATGLAPSQISFTLDGFRDPAAAAKGVGSYFDRMRKAFREKAQSHGYEVIDLQPLFLSHFDHSKAPLEYSMDAHWNPTAISIAAKAMLSSQVVGRLLTSPDRSDDARLN